MTPEVTLGAIILAPVVLLTVLRINATLVFLSLCLGDVLVQFVASDVAAKTARLQGNNASLVLLLAPLLLTALFMLKTVNGKFRLILNLLPAAGVGLLGALLIVPLLPPGLSTNIVGSSLWSQVEHLQNLIVGASALVCLFVLWLQRPKTGEGKHGKHHKK